MRRWSVAVCAVVVVTIGLTTQSSATSDRLPDLGMAPLKDIRVEKSGSRLLLKFSATIVNVGSGPFEVNASRASTSDTTMTATQRVYDTSGATHDVATAADLIFGGDGHLHWHIHDLEIADLVRLDNGTKVGSLAKRGYCFWDNDAFRTSLPGAPSAAVYDRAGCGGPNSLSVSMGLSVGWGDTYPSSLPDQYVDITGLTPGRYRLQVTADGLGQFLESNESNNQTWVDLQIKGQGQPKIVGRAPAL